MHLTYLLTDQFSTRGLDFSNFSYNVGLIPYKERISICGVPKISFRTEKV